MRRELKVPPVWRTAVWCLLAIMVLAQTSALMHRLLHLHVHPGGGVAMEVTVQERGTYLAESTTEAAPVKPKLADLWGEHKQRSDCQLFDELATVAPMLAMLVSVAVFLPRGLVLGAWSSPSLLFERFYSAQAPPVRI